MNSKGLVLAVVASAFVAACGPSPEQIAREQAQQKLEQMGWKKRPNVPNRRLLKVMLGRRWAKR
jgi:hypothetical protein